MTGIIKTTPSTATLSAWTSVHPALGVSPMDHLFNRMDGIYMGKWRKEFTSTMAIENWKEAWAEAFSEEGISFDEIKRGIVTCRKQYDWAPSLPEFIKACRPALDYETAFHEAVEQMAKRHAPKQTKDGLVSQDKWSHPAIYWAAAKLGNDLAGPYGSIKGRWKQSLDQAMANPRGEVPALLHALPAPGKCSVSPEEAKRRIEEIKKMFAGKTVMPKAVKSRPERLDLAAAEAELLARKKIPVEQMGGSDE